mmetsp:Transcript_75480/g.233016  ORF Transcript_75480/g.233016 Transcript_75480/m.233016 type:complete len:286 (+) Transcript_75480:1189-2046(+)
MGPVVRRVHAPGITRPGVRGVLDDPVHDRVTHDHVPVGHVDLRAQDRGTLLDLTRAHPPEDLQTLGSGPGPVGAVLAGRSQRASVLGDLLGAQLIHVRPAPLDEQDCPVVELLEVVRCVVCRTGPLKPQPPDVLLDAVDELLLLARRVGVIEAQVARAAELVRDAEVQADGLRVPDVQVAVWLGWKPCPHKAAIGALVQIFDHNVLHEVPRLHNLCGRASSGALSRLQRDGPRARGPTTPRPRPAPPRGQRQAQQQSSLALADVPGCPAPASPLRACLCSGIRRC